MFSLIRNFAGAMEKMTEMKAALFDLDGVVFDTEPQYTVFWGEQCREFHPEHPGLEHEIKGQTLVQIYDAWFSGPLQDRQALITERLDRFEQQMAYEYVPGFETFVRQLRQRGVRTAVVTSSNRVKMEAVYQAHPGQPRGVRGVRGLVQRPALGSRRRHACGRAGNDQPRRRHPSVL